MSQSTSYILSWLQRPLKRNYPHSKKMYTWWFQKTLFPLKIEPKIILLSYNLGSQFSGICTWKFSNTFKVKDLRFFWLLRVHGLVDLNVCRIVDFFSCPFSHRKSYCVTNQYHVRAILLQWPLFSGSLAVWNLLRPRRRILSSLVSIWCTRGTMEKQTFKNLHIYSFFQWKR